jgi:putative acetyltransferase
MSAIVIRPVMAEDIKDLTEIYSFEEIIANTLQIPHRDAKFWQDFYKSRDPSGVELAAMIDGKVVGHLGMILNHTPRRKHVGTFGICVHPHHHGQGVGSALISEMINMADNWLNLLRIELSVASGNPRAIALYSKFGFTTERVSRFDVFSAGRYTDTTHMARFHPAQIGLVTGSLS